MLQLAVVASKGTPILYAYACAYARKGLAMNFKRHFLSGFDFETGSFTENESAPSFVGRAISNYLLGISVRLISLHPALPELCPSTTVPNRLVQPFPTNLDHERLLQLSRLYLQPLVSQFGHGLKSDLTKSFTWFLGRSVIVDPDALWAHRKMAYLITKHTLGDCLKNIEMIAGGFRNAYIQSSEVREISAYSVTEQEERLQHLSTAGVRILNIDEPLVDPKERNLAGLFLADVLDFSTPSVSDLVTSESLTHAPSFRINAQVIEHCVGRGKFTLSTHISASHSQRDFPPRILSSVNQ